jgi:peptidoglycan hydrolase-like protein with peptidoglycan-binding domain
MRKISKAVASLALIVTLASVMNINTFAASTATVTASSLNVRSGEGTTYSVVTSIPRDEIVNVISINGSWCKISYNGKTGYVSKNYLKMSQTSAPAASATSLRRGDNNDSVKQLQNDLKKLGYFSGTATGLYGSITEEAVIKFQKAKGLEADGIAGKQTLAKIKELISSDSAPATPSVNSGRTDITLRLGSSSKDVTDLQKALKNLGYFSGTVTSYYGSITRTAVIAFQKDKKLTADGIAGPKTLSALYASKNDVALKPNDTSNKPATYTTLRQGDSSDSVKKLQEKLKEKGFFKGTATGFYGSVTTQAVVDFQKNNKLTVDGIAGPKTQEALYGKTTITKKELKVEKADWFSVVGKVFARGDVATVTDVKTKKTFKVKRMGGSNHADVEPLTAEDTKIMKEIYGSWKWDRRAIWVEIDGRKFACSMNGMPHGDQTLPYNNFSGHFCIHAYKSRTHGTNSVCPKHQAAIDYAYEQGTK